MTSISCSLNSDSSNNTKNLSLQEVDVELYEIIQAEKNRQINGIELIASENFTSRAVMECLGSCLTNKYSEGYPNRRYYGGNEQIDKLEILCQRRALKAFNLDSDEWCVNVQPYSGSPANFSVYTGILKPHDRLMGLDLPSGGHLTHGYYTSKKKISASSIFFESMPYDVDILTGLIDYDKLRNNALIFKPKLIIAGITAYSRELDYKRFREICDEVGCYLLSDISHTSGLVAAGIGSNPFKYSDIVTTTTHKTLRGPRSGMIFINKKKNPEFENKINEAVFPSLQGGPHNHQIAAVACQLREVASEEWKQYALNVIKNIKILSEKLIEKGYFILTGGTDNHLLLWNLKPEGLTGSKYQLICDKVGITLNKNTVPGDISPINPSGVRIGSPAMTTRLCNEKDFIIIAEFLHRCVLIAKNIIKTHGIKLVDFSKGLIDNAELKILKNDIFLWASQFPYPGF